MNLADHNDIPTLRLRLAEAEAVIQALRDGSVDMIVAGTGLVGLGGSERPYRVFFDAMNEGCLLYTSRCV